MASAESVESGFPIALKVSWPDQVRSWMGERVAILGPVERADGTPLTGEAAKRYKGRTGTIADVKQVTDGSGYGYVSVTLDDSREVIVVQRRSLRFFAELEVAKRLVGTSLWARGGRDLFPLSIDFKSTDLTDDIRKLSFLVKPLTKVTVTGAAWGDESHPVAFGMKTEDGVEGQYLVLNTQYKVDMRFHGDDQYALEWAPEQDFFLEDPKKTFGCWSKDTWALIRNEQVAVGMTTDMVNAACYFSYTR